MKILSDPENENRSAEEVAELALDALTDYVKQIRADEVDRIARQVVESFEGEKAGGIPARIADAIDDMRSVTHRLAVVGQIQYGPQGATHTVVLGPFRARGILDTKEKFQAAIQSGTAAREAGQHLAWDTKTSTGRGRFMLAPAFRTGREAWDFFRLPKDVNGEPMNLLLPPPRHIAEALAGWKPGLWAEQYYARP